MLQSRNQRSQRFDYPILRNFFFCSLANLNKSEASLCYETLILSKNSEICYIEFKAIPFEFSMTLFKLH